LFRVAPWAPAVRAEIDSGSKQTDTDRPAAVVNRAAVQINRKLKELGIDGRVQAQVHDQLIINVPEDQAAFVAPIIKEIMENTTKLEGVTLKAPPEISLNWRDGH